MKLNAWRKLVGKTLAEVASEMKLAGGARTVHRFETGETDADADLIERLVAYTQGAVTPQDMFETRLEWLRENRPERFEPNDERQAAE